MFLQHWFSKPEFSVLSGTAPLWGRGLATGKISTRTKSHGYDPRLLCFGLRVIRTHRLARQSFSAVIILEQDDL